MFAQNLEYINYNPVTAGYRIYPEEYKYSFPKVSGQAAKFYEFGIDEFEILTHYSGN